MLRFEKLSEYKKYRKNLPQDEVRGGGMESQIIYDLFLIDVGEIAGITTELFIAANPNEAAALRKSQENQGWDLISRDCEPCECCGPYCREMYDTAGGRIIILYTKTGTIEK